MRILIYIQSPFAIWRIPAPHVERLRREFPGHDFVQAHDEQEAQRLVADAEAAFSSHMTPALLAAAPRLRWIHSPAAGVGSMLFPALQHGPVLVTNSRGMAADTMAEHVLAVTLAMFRRLPHALRSQARREWAQDAIGRAASRTIAGSRVLIVGLGATGLAVATRMHALGAEVTGIRRRVENSRPDAVARVAPPSRLRELLPAADVIVLSAPHTPETRHMIGEAELAAMSPRALLVNVSRGRLVDEAALVRALAAGRPGEAALDVFQQEPLPPGSPLWTLPNVLITPHTSGFRADHWDAALRLFAENLRRLDAGLPLRNMVDKEAGY
ncbi:MAG TPA: D-2-hydroxyacid dehydrogenase [Vicinamibacterales bacterium]|nr:D-2-hydroxyacid dehydrogenase [Vicinamibacterales bacterium]